VRACACMYVCLRARARAIVCALVKSSKQCSSPADLIPVHVPSLCTVVGTITTVITQSINYSPPKVIARESSKPTIRK